MWELITLGAHKPEIPIAMGVFLYLWIAVGSFLTNKPDMAGMWLNYSCANAFMYWHYVRTS